MDGMALELNYYCIALVRAFQDLRILSRELVPIIISNIASNVHCVSKSQISSGKIQMESCSWAK